jgi:hypothetical protein
MSKFVQANEYACQGSMYKHALIFVNKFFKFCNLRSLYNAIMHKKGFGQAYCKALLFSVFSIWDFKGWFSCHVPNYGLSLILMRIYLKTLGLFMAFYDQN